MSYGHPFSTGHGHRIPRYRWSPSLDSVSPRHGRSRTAKSRPAPPRRPHPAPSSQNVWELHEGAFHDERVPHWFITVIGFMIFLVLVIHLPFLLLFFLGPSFEASVDRCAKEAQDDILSSMDKMSKSLRIQRKTSVDPPPTPEAVRAAWAAARRSLEGKLLAGTLLSSLEPVVDQSYIREEDGTIVGRRAGIKGWLAANCPDMLPHYKALMSYKALSDKLCITLGINEPDTIRCIIDFGWDAATDDGGKAPKSLYWISNVGLLKSNKEEVVRKIYSLDETLHEAWSRTGRAGSMAALDAVLREQLGLVWMRRGRRERGAA